jgi:hypothetical protein
MIILDKDFFGSEHSSPSYVVVFSYTKKFYGRCMSRIDLLLFLCWKLGTLQVCKLHLNMMWHLIHNLR